MGKSGFFKIIKGDVLKLLFIDIDSDFDYQEAALVYQTLRFKLVSDFIYPSGLPYMSRAYYPITEDHISGKNDGIKHTLEIKKNAVSFLSAMNHTVFKGSKLNELSKEKPDILFICGHGLDGDEIEEEFGWYSREGEIVLSFDDLKAFTQDNKPFIVSNSCYIGRKDIAQNLINSGFKAVIAWPAATCMTETLSFHSDFFEFIAFTDILTQPGNNADLHQSVETAFDYAVSCLKARYTSGKRTCNSAFGHYWHTKGFKKNYSIFPKIIN